MHQNNLASRWRPKIFEEVIGQSYGLKTLTHFIEKNKPHPAILFSGTRGVGKTTLARIFAKSLNCEKGVTAHPCLICASCRATQIGEAIDVLEIDAASKTKVEDIRDLIENIGYLPLTSRYKVYLLDEVHMLSRHSFNALLKILEEPPAHVQFLFATTEPEKLPQTFRSRLLEIQLKPVSSAEMVQYLTQRLEQESIGYESEALALLVQSAEGSVREALTLLDQALSQTGDAGLTLKSVHFLQAADAQLIAVELLEALLEGDQVKVVATFERIDQLDAIWPLVDHLIRWLQHAAANLTYQLDFWPPVTIAGQNFERLKKRLLSLNARQLIQAYQAALTARRELEWAPCAKLVIEMFAVRWHELFATSGPSLVTAPKKALVPAISKSDAVTETLESSSTHASVEENPHVASNQGSNVQLTQAQVPVSTLQSTSAEDRKALHTDAAVARFAEANPFAVRLLKLPVGPVAKQLLWHSIICEASSEDQPNVRIVSSQAFASFQTERVKQEVVSAWKNLFPEEPKIFLWELKRQLPTPSLHEQFKALRAETSNLARFRIEQDSLSQSLRSEMQAELVSIVSENPVSPTLTTDVSK